MEIKKGQLIDNETGDVMYPQTSSDMVEGMDKFATKEEVDELNKNLSNNYKSIINLDKNTNNTIPNDGVVLISGGSSAKRWSYIQFFVNNVLVFQLQSSADNAGCSVTFPWRVRKGDVVKCAADEEGNVTGFKFIPNA